MNKEEAQKCVGNRVLAKRRLYGSEVTEVIVLEVSPTGDHFCIMYPATKIKSWEETGEYRWHLVEVLGPYRKT